MEEEKLPEMNIGKDYGDLERPSATTDFYFLWPLTSALAALTLGVINCSPEQLTFLGL
jgi:hypothetical protein